MAMKSSFRAKVSPIMTWNANRMRSKTYYRIMKSIEESKPEFRIIKRPKEREERESDSIKPLYKNK